MNPLDEQLIERAPRKPGSGFLWVGTVVMILLCLFFAFGGVINYADYRDTFGARNILSPPGELRDTYQQTAYFLLGLFSYQLVVLTGWIGRKTWSWFAAQLLPVYGLIRGIGLAVESTQFDVSVLLTLLLPLGYLLYCWLPPVRRVFIGPLR